MNRTSNYGNWIRQRKVYTFLGIGPVFKRSYGRLSVTIWLFHRQVLREEDFLMHHYGTAYADYCSREEQPEHIEDPRCWS